MPLVQIKTPHDAASSRSGSALEHALRHHVQGEVRFDRESRGLYSMDASNFRVPPVGVVVPADVNDVVRAVQVCREHGASVVSRGGGTGLAGQAVNRAVVLDHSKYLRKIVSIDEERRLARVQAGCVLDDLREQTRTRGLTYGPDPSTHDRCTLGGMIGSNACGVHAMLSEFYGPGPRTEDNVESLEVLTYDGLRLCVGPTSEEEYGAIQRDGGRKAEIYRGLRELRDRHTHALRNSFPSIQRRVSGYNLPALLPENGFDVGSALVGSEGTCVTVLEATLKLSPEFPHRVLVILGYPDVFAAADDVPRVREHRPIGLEGIDQLLIQYIRKKDIDSPDELLPEGRGWLMVEFGGYSHEEAVDRARACVRDVGNRPGAPAAHVIEDLERQHRVWKMRKSALGATAFVPNERATWPGWEDSAVPVNQVGRYLRRLQGLFDKHGYRAALYGHFGQGCIHTRINFDLVTSGGVATYRRFTREAAELCVSLGGSLSGEHGDGQQRSDLLPVMYDGEVLAAFEEFKSLWDPRGKMNPGRIVRPRPRDMNLRLGPHYQPWRPETHFAYPEDDGDFSHAALRCVGVGECRKDGGGTMCPSYMVTHEEAHSTRGRARLLFEMVEGDVIKNGWQSKEVLDALELCLSCKACKSECPVNVDMSKYKSEFLFHHYARKLRPRQAYAFGLVHRWARLGSRIARLSNFVSHAPGLSRVAKWAANMAPEREVPRFATETFRHWFERQPSPEDRFERRVILWPDTFNNHFVPETLKSTVQVLRRAGVDVSIPPKRLCCGRPLYDYGMLDLGRRLFLEILDALETEIEAGTVVVGVEPSCVASLRDELLNQLPDDPRARALAAQTHTLAEYLDGLADFEPPRLTGRAIMQPHCQGDAIMGTSLDRKLLERLGLEIEPLTPGCCGMAGSFGFEKGDKYEVSVAAGERVLLPAVRDAADTTLIVADGFSCREQIAHGTERKALHLAEVLELAARTEEDALREGRPEDKQAQLDGHAGGEP